MNPICVDLDGTLIKTDLLVESVVQYVKKNPLNIINVFLWFIGGKANLKAKLAQKVKLDLDAIPFQEEIIKFCETNAVQRDLYLVTGSNEAYAKLISDRLGYFKGYYASSNELNLTSNNKANFLKEKFPQGFEYIGDSHKDIPVWNASTKGYTVNRKYQGLDKVELVDVKKKGFLKSNIKMIRVHQWAKNFLVFVPLMLAHRFSEADLLINSIKAFISFCLIASSVYVLNDLLDVWSDRKHPKKKNRPIANGDVSLTNAVIAFVLCFSVANIISFSMGWGTFGILVGYFAMNILYSFFLKKVTMLDIFILTSFYIFRVTYGGVSTGVEISYWLISFSFFIFLSLAFLKRFAELKVLYKYHGKTATDGRDYVFDDIPVIMNLGVVSGFASVIVLAFYIHFGNQAALYSSPKFLWGIETLVLYWISLFWIRASRGKIEDDPVKYAIKDKVSWIIALCSLILGGLAK